MCKQLKTDFKKRGVFSIRKCSSDRSIEQIFQKGCNKDEVWTCKNFPFQRTVFLCLFSDLFSICGALLPGYLLEVAASRTDSWTLN